MNERVNVVELHFAVHILVGMTFERLGKPITEQRLLFSGQTMLFSSSVQLASVITRSSLSISVRMSSTDAKFCRAPGMARIDDDDLACRRALGQSFAEPAYVDAGFLDFGGRLGFEIHRRQVHAAVAATKPMPSEVHDDLVILLRS